MNYSKFKFKMSIIMLVESILLFILSFGFILYDLFTCNDISKITVSEYISNNIIWICYIILSILLFIISLSIYISKKQELNDYESKSYNEK